MKSIVLSLSLCFLAIDAFHLTSRVGNGEIAKNAPHACMVLVIRPELEANTAALGSGSIVSLRHVLTAAHVVRGQNNIYRINYVVGTSRRTFDSNFAFTHENFDPENNLNDIALIFLQGGNTFPVNSIIEITSPDDALPPSGGDYTIAGYGFTSVDTIGFASIDAHAAKQQVAINCQFDNYEVTQTHFCGIDDVSSGIVCRGDNGAGLYRTTDVNGTSVNTLVGIASHILPGCSTAGLTAYTRLSEFAVWVNAIIGV